MGKVTRGGQFSVAFSERGFPRTYPGHPPRPIDGHLVSVLGLTSLNMTKMISDKLTAIAETGPFIRFLSRFTAVYSYTCALVYYCA